MELRFEKFQYYQTVLDAASLPEVNSDMIVPDMYPDMLDIADCIGLACIKETVIREDRLDLTGLVRVSVLYRPEGEDGLRKLDISIPFNHVFDGNFPEGSSAHPEVCLLKAEASAVNPRKIAVTARLSVHALVYAPKELSVPCEITGDFELQQKSISTYLSTAVSTKRFTINEPLELPASRPVAEEIAAALPRVEITDIKVVGTKAVVKGVAIINILYLNSGEPYHSEHEFSISQIVEMEGLFENSNVDMNLRVTGIELDLDTSGAEPNFLAAALHLEAQAIARTEHRFEAICDLYSTTRNIRPAMEQILLKNLIERGINRQAVRETIECEEEIRSIVSARVNPGPLVLMDNDEIGCETHISILCLTEEGEYRTLSRKITVASGAISGNMEIYSRDTGEITATPTSGGIELRFSLNFAFIHTSEEKLLVVSGVSEEESGEEPARRPSVILRRCLPDESFWDIAKRYSTTVDNLALANGIDAANAEEFPSGQLLLIPKKRRAEGVAATSPTSSPLDIKSKIKKDGGVI